MSGNDIVARLKVEGGRAYSSDMSDAADATETLGEAIEEVEAAGGGLSSFLERNQTALLGVGAASAAAGGALEGLARRQQDSRVTAGRLAATLDGETTDSIMAMAGSMHDATTDLGELVTMMEIGSQQGIDSAAALQDYAQFWDMVSDATGVSAVSLAESSVALRAVGVAAGEEGRALDAFGYITESTTSDVGDFLRFLERTGPQLRELGADIDDAAAILGVLESEFGLAGRTARTQFRSAVSDSDGTLQGLLDTLGISEQQFASHREQVGEASDVIADNARAYEDSRTAMQRLTAEIEGFLAKHSGLVESLSTLSPVLLGAGGAVFALTKTAAGITAVGTAAAASTPLVRGLWRALGPIAVAIGAATVAWRLFTSAARDAKEGAEQIAAALDMTTGAVSDLTEQTTIQVLAQQDLLDVGQELGVASADLVGAVLGTEGAMQRAQAASDAYIDSLDSPAEIGQAMAQQRDLMQSLGRLRDEYGPLADEARQAAVAQAELEGRILDVQHAIDSGYTNAMFNVSAATSDAARSARDGAGAVGELAGEYQAAEDALGSYLDSVRAVEDPIYRLERANVGVADAQTNYNDALGEYGAGSAEAQTAALELVGAISEMETASLEAQGAAEGIGSRLHDLAEAGWISQDALSDSATAVNNLMDAADEFTGLYEAQVEADTGQAESALQRVITLTGRIPTTITTTHRVVSTQGATPRAKGGPVRPGVTYLVGEQGPELARFDQRGHIDNAQATRRMLQTPRLDPPTTTTTGPPQVTVPVDITISGDVLDPEQWFLRHRKDLADAVGRQVEDVLARR